MLAARLVGRPRVVLLWSVVLYSTVWRGTVLQYVLVVMLVVWRIRIKEKAENRLAVRPRRGPSRDACTGKRARSGT